VSDIPWTFSPPRHSSSPNPNHKPNPKPNTNPTNRNSNFADPTLTVTLLTPLLALTLTEQGRGKCTRGIVQGGLSVSHTNVEGMAVQLNFIQNSSFFSQAVAMNGGKRTVPLDNSPFGHFSLPSSVRVRVRSGVSVVWVSIWVRRGLK